jgi:crotonobetainyl-CoA:carnitine CoA-transferase CaiB-like acyl-CoA transferase
LDDNVTSAGQPVPRGALDGIRVLDLTAGLAGPVAGMLLADLGADVVKIYPPGGGPSRAEPGLHMWDRGKRPAVLESSLPAQLEALDQLVGAADIVLVGTAREPNSLRGAEAGMDGAPDGAGARGAAVSYADLRARGHSPGRPGYWIVMPPYLLGETPWAGEQESAGLLFAWLGHAWGQASYDDVPVDCVFPLALHMQGIWAAITAVALIVGRQRGRRLAPLAVAGGAHGGQLVSPGGFAAGRAEPYVHRPGGPGGALPNYRCYRCSDGQWLFFGAFTNAFIERGMRAAGVEWVLQDPRVGGDPNKVRLGQNLGWITRELEQAFARRPRATWLELLDGADVPAAATASAADWLDHEQVREIGLRTETRNDAGEPIVMPGALIGLSETPVSAPSPARTRRPAITDFTSGWSPRSTMLAQPTPAPALAQPAPATAAAVAPADEPEPGAAELPLAGLRVLNLGTIIAGPYAATLLGELGAEVLKIERPPRGDEFRTAHGGRGGAGFSVYNRDQRSLLLNLADTAGQDVFRQLVRSSDVVINNYRAGVLRRLGIEQGDLAAVNPLITSVSISAFGETGALSQRPGFDPVVQAMSGIMRAQGGPDEAESPAFLTVPVNDVLAAGLAALGVCAALHARERIGHGQLVSVTLCASSCLVQSEHLVRFAGAPPLPVGGRDFAGPAPLDRLYAGADGWVRLGGRQLPDLPALARAGLAEVSGPPAAEPGADGAAASDADASDADASDAAAIDAIGRALARLPVADILRRAAAAGIPAVQARQAPDLIADDQLIRHGLLAVIQQDDTGVTQVGPGSWLEMPGLSPVPPGPAPAPGEHGPAILTEIGAEPAQGR